MLSVQSTTRQMAGRLQNNNTDRNNVIIAYNHHLHINILAKISNNLTEIHGPKLVLMNLMFKKSMTAY